MYPTVFNNVMIDLETWGRRPDGLIVSIGAITFSTRLPDIQAGRIFSQNPADAYHRVLSLDAAQADTLFRKDPATMAWWRSQPQAWEKLTAQMATSALSCKALLEDFMAWLAPKCTQGYNVIGNSPSFDLVLLENACNKLGLSFPVPYRAETDYRTITDLVYGENKPRAPANEAHDALFDARFQAQVYANALAQVAHWRHCAQLQLAA